MLEILRDVIWIPLFAISLIYSAIVRLLFSFRKVHQLSIPVLSVGNIHIGGTGKTPLVIKLAQLSAEYRLLSVLMDALTDKALLFAQIPERLFTGNRVPIYQAIKDPGGSFRAKGS